MADKKVEVVSHGIGFWHLLLIALIVLKVVGYLQGVSWLWLVALYFMPLVGFLVVAVCILAVIGGGLLVAMALDKYRAWARKKDNEAKAKK